MSAFIARLIQASSLAAISAVGGSGMALYHDPANWQIYVPAILIGIAGILKNEGAK